MEKKLQHSLLVVILVFLALYIGNGHYNATYSQSITNHSKVSNSINAAAANNSANNAAATNKTANSSALSGPRWWNSKEFGFAWSTLLLAAGTVGGLTYMISVLIRDARFNKKRIEREKDLNKSKRAYEGSFSDIIRDGDYYPSLPRFQFLLWTVVVTFTFLSVYLIRISGGVLSFPSEISVQILQLMGISAVVPIIGNGLSSYKYAKGLSALTKDQVPGVGDMLLENEKPVVWRYQMFLWTLIGIGIYLLLFFSGISGAIFGVQHCPDSQMNCIPGVLSKLNLPDLDPSLVILMGISQGGYLGGKLVARTPMYVSASRRVEEGGIKKIIILGDNFGNGGQVIINKNVITSQTQDVTWNNNIIKFPYEFEPNKALEIEIFNDESMNTRLRIGLNISEFPNDGEKNIDPKKLTISATFDKDIDQQSINNDNFYIKEEKSSEKIVGIFPQLIDKKVVGFKPQAEVNGGKKYLVTLGKDLKFVDGTLLGTDFTWSFTTSAAMGAQQPDTTPPTVTSKSPDSGATGVAVGSSIMATFSKAVQSASVVTGTTFTLSKSDGTIVAGTVTYDSATNTAAFTPSAALANSKSYTANLTNGINDLAGNALTATSWSFTTTGPQADTIPRSAVVQITDVRGDNGEVIVEGIPTTSNSIIFTFILSGSVSGLHAECQLTYPGEVNPTFEQCDSDNRQTYNDIGLGTHTFVVRAVDDSGTGGSKSFTWTKINAGGGGAKIAK